MARDDDGIFGLKSRAGGDNRKPHGEEAPSRQRSCAVRCAVSNHEGHGSPLILRDAAKTPLVRKMDWGIAQWLCGRISPGMPLCSGPLCASHASVLLIA